MYGEMVDKRAYAGCWIVLVLKNSIGAGSGSFYSSVLVVYSAKSIAYPSVCFSSSVFISFFYLFNNIIKYYNQYLIAIIL